MNKFLIPCSIAVLFAANLVLADFLLSALSLGILSIICIFQYVDLHKLRKTTEKCLLLKEGARKQASGTQVYCSSLAQEVSSLLKLIERKLMRAQTQAQVPTQRFNPEELFPELSYDKEKISDENLFILKRIADAVSRRFHSDGAGIILSANNGEQLAPVLSQAISGKAFSSALSLFFEPYFLGISKNVDEITVTASSDGPLFSLYYRGFRYLVASPISIPNLCQKGVLFLIFKGSGFPDIEKDAFKKFASDIASDYPKFKELYDATISTLEDRLAYRSKSQFLAHMSHDIKSPLNNIKSILNLLRLESKDAENTELIEVSLNNCETVAELVESILDLSAFQAGKLIAQEENFNLTHLLAEVIHTYKVAIRMKGLELKCELPEQPCPVKGDRRQIKRVISNIVSNAVKYTRFGSIEVSIQELTNGNFALCIKDTGVGMNEAQVQRLFVPFTRFHFEESDGVGLGLSLSKILMDLNRGEIKLQSTPGKGTTFSLLFKGANESLLSDNGEVSIHIHPSRALGSVIPLKSGLLKRVLLVDDDAACVESLARHLEKEPFIIVKAASVKDALEISNFEAPDIVITDDAMPDGGGYELIRELRKRRLNIPIALCSGNAALAQAKYKNLCITRVFEKPVEIPQIAEWLNSLVESSYQAPEKACAN